MTPDALVDGPRANRSEGRRRRARWLRTSTTTMKDCVLKLYRSAASGFAEWHDAVDANLSTRPGVVLWGADDPYVTREFGDRLAERTDAKLVMFPDSGHWWPVTKPAEVAAALEALWSSV